MAIKIGLMKFTKWASNMEEIKTVGDLRQKLRFSEDDEPLLFDLEEDSPFGKKKFLLKCVGVGSSGGGRITVLWLNKEENKKVDNYSI